jgi:hypothetical protein
LGSYERKNQKKWWSLIWFYSAIPKHSFINWLAIKDSLTNGDRLLKWGAQGEYKCLFCMVALKAGITYSLAMTITMLWKAVTKK